jgi:hypothetical protein
MIWADQNASPDFGHEASVDYEYLILQQLAAVGPGLILTGILV